MGMLPHDFAPFEQAYGVSFGRCCEPAREVAAILRRSRRAGAAGFSGRRFGAGIPALDVHGARDQSGALAGRRRCRRTRAHPLRGSTTNCATDNPSGMFVNVLCAVFEPKSGGW